MFSVTVDVVCLTVRDGAFQVLLVERGGPPFEGRLALPGGFVQVDENLEDAARRELREETGIEAPRFVEQLATYGEPDRDPRGRTVSVAFLAIAADLGEATGGSDAAAADWHRVDELLRDDSLLAFDHAVILADAVERARGKLEYTPLACDFCPAEFTIAELRRVYETMWDLRLDPANFHRKVTRADGFLVETGKSADGGVGRPAQLYRRGGSGADLPAAEPRYDGVGVPLGSPCRHGASYS
ncbi:NUDIX hydrolase [Nocardioides panacis]|uniref:NUDIX hydrolase n=1 Tax=Nocardioides panacis TaxID=2849501 RepID=A0A975T2M0_9ACTN|nr:NUDIX hydrolase [Nocardioides panacis]